MSQDDLGAAFPDVEATLKADEKAIVSSAVSYLEAAGKAAEGQTSVVVGEVAQDAENLAFKVAGEHGFSAFLALFKSSITGTVAQVTAAATTETNALIQKGIAALQAIKLP